MHQAAAERLRREHAAATVENLATLNAKLDRILELLEARPGPGDAAATDPETSKTRKRT